MNSLYLNSLSLNALVPVLANLMGLIFLLLIKNKSSLTWRFIWTVGVFSVFQLGYVFACIVITPDGAFHRWITVFSVIFSIAFGMQFWMDLFEKTHPRLTRIVFNALMILGLSCFIFFVISTVSAPRIYRPEGQYWDFQSPLASAIIALCILIAFITAVSLSIIKFRSMKNRKDAKTYLVLFGAFYGVMIPIGFINGLAKRGIVSTEFHFLAMSFGFPVIFFVVFVYYLGHTKEKTSVVGNLLGIIIVSILTFSPGLTYPLLEQREKSFQTIWEKNAELIVNGRKGNADIVFISDSYYRDNSKYYRQYAKSSLEHNTMLAADNITPLYIFHSNLAEGKIVGVNLKTYRNYLSKTANTLFSAQIAIVALIAISFPFFFRGVLLDPMKKLLDGVVAISRGRLVHRIGNQRSDELGVISQLFNKMAISLEASTTKLEETVNKRTSELKLEKDKSETLLLNILPENIANELKEKGSTKPVRIDSASVIFTDFVGFTKIAEDLSPEDVVSELDKCFSYFDQVTEKYNLEKLKTIGDAFMCAGGLPIANKTHAIDCCLAALEIQAFMNQMKEIKEQQGDPYWELRLGINTGPLVAGVVGTKKFAYDVWGDTVNTASRMESSGVSGFINISQSTYEQVKYFFDCEHRGKVKAKNKGEIDMYFLNGLKPRFSVNGNGLVPNKEMKKLYVAVRRGKKIRYKKKKTN